MAHYEPSQLDLHCLQKPIIIACGSERVKQEHVLITYQMANNSYIFYSSCKFAELSVPNKNFIVSQLYKWSTGIILFYSDRFFS